MPEIEKTSVFGTAVHAVIKKDASVDADGLVKRLAGAGVAATQVAPVAPSLEDVFLEVVDQAR